MKHVVIGNGNLGSAIATELLERGQEVKIFSTSNGWRYPASLQPIYDQIPNHVWLTVGAGSVEQAKTNYLPFIDLHIKLPVELAQNLNSRSSLHIFSTDYVIDHRGKSLYALSKKTMEEAIILINRQNTYIYRIGSLYGTHKPSKCFPYKLKKNSLKNEPTLPKNLITPTPTDWLAELLINNLEVLPTQTSIFHAAPQGNVSVKVWGEMILKKEIMPIDYDIDPSRPTHSCLGCDLPVKELSSWLVLWQEREDYWQNILNEVR